MKLDKGDEIILPNGNETSVLAVFTDDDGKIYTVHNEDGRFVVLKWDGPSDKNPEVVSE